MSCRNSCDRLPLRRSWSGCPPSRYLLLYTTSVTQAEIVYGLRLLPDGRRRVRLESAAEQMFAEDCADRILPFDQRAAIHYARFAAERRRRGQPSRSSMRRLPQLPLQPA